MPEWHQFRDIEPGEKFCVFADTSVGGLDSCAVQFLSETKLDVPLVYHDRIIATQMTNALWPVLNRLADVTGFKPLVAYERNNGGAFEMDRLASLNRDGKFDIFLMPSAGMAAASEPRRLGWDTNSATRPQMLGNLKEAVDQCLLTLYHPETVKELFSFVVVKTAASWKAQAENGAHDDLVMSLAGAWQLHLSGHTWNALHSGYAPVTFEGSGLDIGVAGQAVTF
jgi:hypothetical protein